MTSIKEREKNLFNATDTLAQFYDEIESFLDILFREMSREGYSLKGERLRSGTFTNRNLTRRLLASTTVMYFKGAEEPEEGAEGEEEEEGAAEAKKAAKIEIPIAPALRLPFVAVWLFSPRSVPTVRTLSPPQLLMGAFGKFTFVDKGSGNVAKPESPALAVTNLANISVLPSAKAGDIVPRNCWKPKRMSRYRMEAELVAFEARRLLNVDSQAEIKKIADRLIGFCKGRKRR